MSEILPSIVLFERPKIKLLKTKSTVQHHFFVFSNFSCNLVEEQIRFLALLYLKIFKLPKGKNLANWSDEANMQKIGSNNRAVLRKAKKGLHSNFRRNIDKNVGLCFYLGHFSTKERKIFLFSYFEDNVLNQLCFSLEIIG